ncbi:MAG: hypothetical protein AB8C46_22400 [Burkholderiaceae bacterium]
MPTLDPQLNQIIWWIVLGAFIGWLLWVLIDRFIWRDGESSAVDEQAHAELLKELENARREEGLLRTELVREQEETQRLIGITKDLRDKLDGQEQIVANLEAALDAARFSSPGQPGDAGAGKTGQFGVLPNASLAGGPKGATTESPANADQTAKQDPKRDGHDPVDPELASDGEQALRDLLAESDFTEDLDDLLTSEDDLFAAPTDVLTTRARLGDTRTDTGSDPLESSTQIRYTKPAPQNGAQSNSDQNGPMTDAELDRLLNLDTGKLFSQGISGESTEEADPSDSNPDGHTLSMLDRLREESGAETKNTEHGERKGRDSSLIGRLRNAFGRKPDGNDR